MQRVDSNLCPFLFFLNETTFIGSKISVEFSVEQTKANHCSPCLKYVAHFPQRML